MNAMISPMIPLRKASTQITKIRPVTMVTDDGRMDAGTLDYDGSAGLTLLGQRVRGSYLPARPGQAASGSGR